jgi:hypothetical protein
MYRFRIFYYTSSDSVETRDYATVEFASKSIDHAHVKMGRMEKALRAEYGFEFDYDEIILSPQPKGN